MRSKFILPDSPNYPADALHIWAENNPVLDAPLFKIEAIDKIPENVPISRIDAVYNRNQMDTGGLARKLSLKINAKVMLTSNINVSDKLSNGQIGSIYHIKRDSSGNIIKLYIKMSDPTAGLEAIRSDHFAMQYNVVPIEKVEKDIKFNKNSPSSLVMKVSIDVIMAMYYA